MKDLNGAALRTMGRLRLIWSVVVILLLSFSGSLVWFAYDEYQRTLEREFRYLESNARIADAQMSSLLRSVHRLLADIAGDFMMHASESVAEARFDIDLVEQRRLFPEIRTLAVTDATGRVILSGVPDQVGADLSDREYFLAHRQGQGGSNVFVSAPYRTRFGDQSIAFSHGLFDAQNRFGGIVVAGLDPKYIDTILSQVRPDYPNSTAFLFHQSGAFVHRLPDPERYVGARLGGLGFLAHKQSGLTMTRRASVATSDGVRRLAVFRNLDDSPLGIGISRGYHHALEGWYRNLALRVALFVLTTIVVVSLMIRALRRERERHELAVQLRQSVDRLTSSNTELERFAHVASHDLREPVRTLVSFSQLLERRLGTALSPDVKDYLDYVVGAAKRMDALVSDLLTYARVSSDVEPFRPVDLDLVLAEVRLDLADALARTGATLEAPRLPTVMGTRMQLHQLLQNLVSNALKFQSPGTPPRLVFSRTDEPGQWRISLTDNGIGLDPKYAEQIFVIFKRLHSDQAYPGTGVGLAVCRRIMERHNGRIWAESAGEGRGATFHLVFLKADAAGG
ncbi:MAG: hypothetical protein IT565_11395 [Rhodospirillales bacterium]|nr:hypothetical protein [Rhodospirillales bacterium]